MIKAELTAIDAKFEAQKIAFSPIFFQAILAMRDLGVLQYIYAKRGNAIVADIYKEMNLTKYAIEVMVEAATVMNVVEVENGKAKVTKVGYYMLKDEMTRVNVNFINDVCYDGAKFLKESLAEEKPVGLKVFGDWQTVYQGLAHLTPSVRKSWLEFDHFYSQDAFDEALKIVFSEKPKYLFDIGGNTGKWAFKCCEFDENVNVKILDLPGQIAMAKINTEEKGLIGRIDFHPINILDASQKIPKGASVIWMSQFLDCFSEKEISLILNNCAQASDENTFIYIMEPFIDNQEFPAAEFSLVGTSLYFTCIANGNSKMYKISVMEDLVNKAGMEVCHVFPLIGDSYHTILKCRLKKD